MTIYEGYTGTITTGDEGLVITRASRLARIQFGSESAPRRVGIGEIVDVRFKPSSRLVNGWVQLVLAGQPAPQLTAGTAASNPETVLFKHSQREGFAELHKWLQGAVIMNQDG